MRKNPKKIMDPKIVDLCNDYNHGRLERRDFLKTLAKLAGGVAAAVALLPFLESSYGKAQIVAEDDSRLHTEYIQYTGETGDVRAYLARPKREGKLPGVIVIHENKGLQPHIEDVNRRVALEGFLAIAVDALAPLGGTPKDNVDEARTLMRKLDGPATVKNYVAAVEYLKTHPEDVPKIKASLLCHYAGQDERINAGIPAFEEALKQTSVEYEIHMYEGVGHAFHNDTGSRYNREAAQLAFKRTIAFFKEKLKN
jgi:carboxymethylenebutenolidase